MGDVALYRRLLRQTRHYWRHIAALFALGVLASPIALLNPVPLKIVFDSVLDTKPLPPFVRALVPASVVSSWAAILALAIALLLVVTTLGQLQSLATTLLRTYIGERLVLDFRSQLVQRVQRLSLSYHDSRGTADSVYRIQYDAPAIQNILIDGAIPFVSAAITVATMWLVTARLDRQLALVALAVSPPLFILSRLYRPRMRRQSRQVKKLESSALAVVQETLGALRVVKAFGQEAHETGRFVHRSREGVVARIRLAFLEGGFGVLIGVVMTLGTAAVWLIGVGHVRAESLTRGELLLVLGYLAQLYDPLKTMSRKASGLQGYLASAERAFALLDEQPDVPERPQARPVARARGAVEFRGVSFAYGPERPVLENVSFAIEPGTRLGVVGATGAGKTTLISLLTRFYDPTAGQIRLDGVDLRDYKLDDLRRQFAVVLQDTVLFSASIAENIAYAAPGASREQIVAAAHAANADEFIARLPQGYDTQVGERGLQLSGGQRQRIALARAFLKDSPVLILDEPTSAVDAETEAKILGAMRHLMRGRTVLLISHRPSTLERCDALLLLDRGRIVTDTSRPIALTPRPPGGPATRRSTLRSHPAVRAWCELHPSAEPVQLTPLRFKKRKSSVYRLEGAGPGGAAVIAKRCPKAVGLVERTVYGDLLPRVAVPSLRYYGFLEDHDTEWCWLFIEEAQGADYSNLIPEHRVRAGRWLGTVHTGAADATDGARLPDGGPARYRRILGALQDTIRRSIDNPVFSPDDVVLLERLLARLDDLAGQWRRVEEICAGVPATLVHGDFNGRNIRLRTEAGDATVVVFDWEVAGWGVPAVDLAQVTVPTSQLCAAPDIPTYWSSARERWPMLSLEACWRLAHCGTLFRTLAAMSWNADDLANDWAHACLTDMRLYAAELDGALERLDWLHRRSPRQETAAT
ncbi:MAG TPA: ATP-binding cassette domain-containing protein [Gemmatimonadales bacterium]|nr:ATP-binding cassette domain-containing protein [Gemmatimonadales bacterium]